jgi:hypothetical protein
MKCNKLPPQVVAFLLSAGVAEEIVAGTQHVFVTCNKGRPGRPRKYKNRAECDRAYRERRKQRTQEREKIQFNIRTRLIDASNGNIDALADISPIRALIAQSCDLEADVLPTVARTVPELPRPVRNWGAQWLVREILAAREQRLNRFADSVKGVAALART